MLVLPLSTAAASTGPSAWCRLKEAHRGAREPQRARSDSLLDAGGGTHSRTGVRSVSTASVIPKRSAGVSAIYTYVQSPVPSLPTAQRGLGVQALCPSSPRGQTEAGSPDPSRVLLLVLFAVLEPAGGNPAGGTSWGPQAGREGQRCLRATSSSLLFRPRAGGGGSRLGSAVPLCCNLAGDLPVRSSGQGLRSGGRMQAPPEQSEVSLIAARAETTSGAKCPPPTAPGAAGGLLR